MRKAEYERFGEWLHPGGFYGTNHFFPKRHNFTAICGFHSGALNGGHRVREQCADCKEMVADYVAKAHQKWMDRAVAWKSSKKRTALLRKIHERLEDLDKESLETVLAEIGFQQTKTSERV